MPPSMLFSIYKDITEKTQLKLQSEDAENRYVVMSQLYNSMKKTRNVLLKWDNSYYGNESISNIFQKYFEQMAEFFNDSLEHFK